MNEIDRELKLTKKTQYRTKCVFGCDGKISGEHILADWISREFPRLIVEHNEGSWMLADDKKTLVFKNVKNRQGDVRQVKSNYFCEKCNNEWMSIIVNEAKPSLLKILKNENLSLTQESMRDISSFAVLSAIAFERKQYGKKLAVSDYDLEYLKHNMKPNKNWQVYVGKTKDEAIKYGFGGIQMCLRPKGSNDQEMNAFDYRLDIDGTTLIVRYNRSVLKNNVIFHRFHNTLTQIWPTNEAQIDFDFAKQMNSTDVDNLIALTSVIGSQIAPVGPSDLDFALSFTGLFNNSLH